MASSLRASRSGCDTQFVKAVQARVGVAVVAGILFGLWAEWELDRFARPVVWVPDLVVGLCLIVLGSALYPRLRIRREADLLFLAAGVWFLPNFAGSSVPGVEFVASHTAGLHRAMIFQAILALPSGRLRGRRTRAAVTLGYVMTVLPAAGTSSGMIVVGLCMIVAIFVLVGADDLVRTDKRLVGLGFGFLLIAVGVARSATSLGASQVVTVLYDLGIIVIAVLIARTAMSEVSRWNRRADALLAISLGPEESIRGLLADAFGDPSIKVAYALRTAALPEWVDELGRTVEAPTAERRSRPVVVNDEVVAVMTSEHEWLDDPDVQRLAEAVAATASQHATLRARLRSDAVELEASRRRLLVADDDARVGFSLELAGGATASLLLASEIIDELPINAASNDVGETIASAREQLVGARSDLSRFAAGLGPAELDEGGLGSALEMLARSGPNPVDLDVASIGWLPRDVAVGAYFVCAEGVANAWKHAMATSIHVSVFRLGTRLVLEVADDGRGGARVEDGHGLGHLAERAAAMRGTVTIVSPPGGGTRLIAELPVGEPGDQARPTVVS